MFGTTVVFRMFRDAAREEDAVPHRKARLLRREAAVGAAMHTRQRTVRRRMFSVPTGTSALLRPLHECPTDAKFSSRRRSKDSFGQSTLIPARCCGSRTWRAKS